MDAEHPHDERPDETGQAHRSRTRREFARQAATFEAHGSVFRDESVLDWISRHLPSIGDGTVLDVAGGTGQLGRHIVREGGFAVIADLTPEMLAEGARAVRETGRSNVVFLEADATSLPFADEQFDLVVSRFAIHHIDDPALAAREMARVCRRGGTVVLIDMVRESGESGLTHNDLERLRDPSHRAALEEHELVEILTDAGISAQALSERHEQIAAHPWLGRAQPSESDREKVLKTLRAEADGSAPSGLHASVDADELLTVTQRWLIAAGRRA